MVAVTVERSVHGPFERLSLVAATPGGRSQLSVYRAGDTLIDTGGTLVADALLPVLAERPPRRIVCTHQHEDHVGNIAAIRRAFGHIPVFAPRAHLPIIAAPAVPAYRAMFFGLPEPVPAAELTGYDPGATFDIDAGVTVEALLTPGHTPHHIALMASVGDQVFALSADLYTSKPLEGWYESAADDMAASWRLLARRGDALRLLPTHGRTRDDAASLLDAGADWLDTEADAVRAAAERLGTRDPRTVAAAHYTALGPDPVDRLSGGEISRAAFVRSVLAPVRELPASIP